MLFENPHIAHITFLGLTPFFSYNGVGVQTQCGVGSFPFRWSGRFHHFWYQNQTELTLSHYCLHHYHHSLRSPMYSLYRDVVVYSKACGFDHTDIHDYAQSTKVCVVMDFKTCKQKHMALATGKQKYTFHCTCGVAPSSISGITQKGRRMNNEYRTHFFIGQKFTRRFFTMQPGTCTYSYE